MYLNCSLFVSGFQVLDHVKMKKASIRGERKFPTDFLIALAIITNAFPAKDFESLTHHERAFTLDTA